MSTTTTALAYFVPSEIATVPSRAFPTIGEARAYAAEIGAIEILDAESGETISDSRDATAARAGAILDAIRAALGGE